MKNKRVFITIFVFFIFMSKIFSQVGFSFDTSVFIPNESKYYSDYSYSKRSAVFYKADFIFYNATLSFVPEIYYDYSDYPKFIFQYFDFSLFMNNFSLRLRKNKFSSNIGNIYSSALPYNTVKNQTSYCNLDLTFPIGHFSFILQEVLDSENLDNYKKPEWETSLLKIKYDSEKLESSVLNNFFYDWNKNHFVYNGEFFVNYIASENFNFYADVKKSFCDQDALSVLTGVNILFLTGDFVPSLALEYANVENKNIAGAFLNFSYSDCVNFYLGGRKNFNVQNHFGILSELKVSFNDFVFNILFEWEDLSERKKYMTLGVSLNEK